MTDPTRSGIVTPLHLPAPLPQYDRSNEGAVRSQIEQFSLIVSRMLVGIGAASGGGAVTSVFGRTGVVAAAANDYTFAQLASPPTNLAGYGITDAAHLVHTHAASDVVSGVLPIARVATGTPTGSKFVRDDGTLAVPPGSGLPTTGGTMTGGITETVISPPSTPAAGALTTFAATRNGRPLQHTLTDSGRLQAVQGSLIDERLAMIVAVGASSSPSAIGVSIGSSGSASTNVLATTNKLTMHRRVIYTSSAAINSAANLTTQAMWAPGSVAGFGGFDFYARVVHETNVASTRFFAGMAATATALPTSGEPSALTTAKIGIGLDTTDTNYQLIYNASGAASTKIDLGIARASATPFELYLYSQPGTVGITYRVVGTVTGTVLGSGTLTTLIPGASDFLGFQLAAYTAAATSAVACGMSRMVCMSDN